MFDRPVIAWEWSDVSDRTEPHEHPRRKAKSTFRDDAFERAAAIFRAASDPNRLKMLERLSSGEWCVSELAGVAGAHMSTVSQQLRLLRAERLVTRRRDGAHLYYSLADAHVASLIHAALEHASEPKSIREKDDDDEPQDPRKARSRSR